MITDARTNFVYIADTLAVKYPVFAKALTEALCGHGIPHGVLPGTKDVWAVDYMPVQVSENRFVRFSYEPDYLISTKKWSKTISDVDAICEKTGIKTIKSEIILDGGNLSRWDDKVLMTSKVFAENRQIPEIELIQRLRDLLEVNEVFFVPVEKGDWLGHIDAMARFAGPGTVIINDYSREPQSARTDLLCALHNAGLNWITFPFDPYHNEDDNDATGVYLNYLELEKFIILPVFGIDTDQAAIQRAKEIFPGKTIIPVKSNQPAKDNGLINCLTWNIKI